MELALAAFWAAFVPYIPGLVSAVVLGGGAWLRAWLQARAAAEAVRYVQDAPGIDTSNDTKLVLATTERLAQTLPTGLSPITQQGAVNLASRAVGKAAKD